MAALRAALTEVVHLFVDDGSLALALVAWCAIVGVAVLALPVLLPVSGPLLFLGCAAILVGNVVLVARARAIASEQLTDTRRCRKHD